MIKKYWAFFSISYKQSLANRGLILGVCFFLFILLFVYNRLWEVIGIQSNDSQLNNQFIWYLLMAEMIILSTPRSERIFEDDVKSGTLAYYLNKPVSFFGMRFAEAIGSMTVPFCIMCLFGALITLILDITPPFTWYNFPIIFLMCYISSIINVFFYCGVGLCALWLDSTRTLAMAIQRLAFILGGAIFPLTIYPEWFVSIAKWTPFYSIYYLTIKLVYDFSWANLWQALYLNLIWFSIIGAFVSFSYHKLSKKVDVYGG